MAAGVRISVCVATFNGERHVREQLQSVLSQLGPDDEVIVSDDHSGDGTVAEVEAVADPRVTLIRNAETVGYSSNFARALERATGEYIFLCDQDDVWLPGKVPAVLTALADADLPHDVGLCDDAPQDARARPVVSGPRALGLAVALVVAWQAVFGALVAWGPDGSAAGAFANNEL